MKLDSVRTKSQLSEAPHGELETAIVKLLIDVGFQHKRVAALFDCNQGRIAEIATGKKGAGIQYTFAPVAAPEWPLDAPQTAALSTRNAELDAENARLRAERDSLLNGHRILNISCARLQDRAETAEAHLVEAMKALEPFAAVAEHDIGDDETDEDIFWPISNARYSMSGRLRVGHLRTARRVREGGKASGDLLVAAMPDEYDIEQAITDSIDLDWTPRDAAKAVMLLLSPAAQEAGK